MLSLAIEDLLDWRSCMLPDIPKEAWTNDDLEGLKIQNMALSKGWDGVQNALPP